MTTIANILNFATKIAPLGLLLVAAPVAAQTTTTSVIRPAPQGNPLIVARRIVSENWSMSVCPLVTRAFTLPDGAIRATCDNGEAFMVFSALLDGKLETVALRCAATLRRGMSVEGCPVR